MFPVCPFNSEPLIMSGDYAYCKPSSVGDCPVGFLCDQSFVLGRYGSIDLLIINF